jgi:hypothetical protein
MRDESNPTFHNSIASKNIRKIFVCSGHSHSEYRLQQLTRLRMPVKEFDQIWIKVANTDTGRPDPTRIVVNQQCWLEIHFRAHELSWFSASRQGLIRNTSAMVSMRNKCRQPADKRLCVVDLVAMLSILERIGAIRPIHFRHAKSAIEEVRNHERTDVQSI